MGTSAGGMRALQAIIPALPANLPLPIAIVHHLDSQADGYLCEFLDRISAVMVKEADEKERLNAGSVYLAPAGYHLLIEPDRSFSLSIDEKVNFSRPSIDLLFESAADTYGATLIGIVLTGANSDGARGLRAIKRQGGLAIVENPETAEVSQMPNAAIQATEVDHVESLDRIASLLMQLCSGGVHGVGK